MKKFKSIERAIRRGHLRKEWDSAIQKVVLKRKISKYHWVDY